MPNQALMMLDAFDRLHPLDKDTLDFMRRILNTAYQEGKLEGFRQFMGDISNNDEQGNTIHNKCRAAKN